MKRTEWGHRDQPVKYYYYFIGSSKISKVTELGRVKWMTRSSVLNNWFPCFMTKLYNKVSYPNASMTVPMLKTYILHKITKWVWQIHECKRSCNCGGLVMNLWVCYKYLCLCVYVSINDTYTHSVYSNSLKA